MRATCNLDDDLLSEAQRLTGMTERTALIHEGLRALIQRESAQLLARLGATEPSLHSEDDLGHAAYVVTPAAGLGHHADSRIAAQVAVLLGARDADRGQRGRVVQEPQRYRGRRPVGVDGGEHVDLRGQEKSLDGRVGERLLM